MYKKPQGNYIPFGHAVMGPKGKPVLLVKPTKGVAYENKPQMYPCTGKDCYTRQTIRGGMRFRAPWLEQFPPPGKLGEEKPLNTLREKNARRKFDQLDFDLIHTQPYGNRRYNALKRDDSFLRFTPLTRSVGVYV